MPASTWSTHLELRALVDEAMFEQFGEEGAETQKIFVIEPDNTANATSRELPDAYLLVDFSNSSGDFITSVLPNDSSQLVPVLKK